MNDTPNKNDMNKSEDFEDITSQNDVTGTSELYDVMPPYPTYEDPTPRQQTPPPAAPPLGQTWYPPVQNQYNPSYGGAPIPPFQMNPPQNAGPFTAPNFQQPIINNYYNGSGMPYAYRSKTVAILLCCLGFIGIGGIHRFYTGYLGMGFAQFFTVGFCYIGTIVDLIAIATDTYRDANRLPLI